MIRKIACRATATALAVTAGLAVLVSGPAAMADTTTACPEHYACIWQDSNWLTNGNPNAYVKWQMYIPKLSTWNYAGTSLTAQDSASSTWNNTDTATMYYFQNTYCGGYVFTKAHNTGDADFASKGPYFDQSSANDRLSSVAGTDYVTTCKSNN